MSSKDLQVGIDGEKVVLIVSGKRRIRGYQLEPENALRLAVFLTDGAIEVTTGEDRGFNEESVTLTPEEAQRVLEWYGTSLLRAPEDRALADRLEGA